MENDATTLQSKEIRTDRLDGVVIGALVGLSESGIPIVAFPGNAAEGALNARSTVPLSADDIGAQVALMFEAGDPAQPIVIGRIQQYGTDKAESMEVASPSNEGWQAKVDNERLEFEAQNEIVLRCGKASITLTRAGKVIIRGTYVLSRSSGVNKVKGGSIQLN